LARYATVISHNKSGNGEVRNSGRPAVLFGAILTSTWQNTVQAPVAQCGQGATATAVDERWEVVDVG